MKAKVYDWIKTLEDVPGFVKKVFSQGIEGTIVFSILYPEEYAVDVNIPDENAHNGYEYDNVVLLPDQFVVLKEYKREEPTKTWFFVNLLVSFRCDENEGVAELAKITFP